MAAERLKYINKKFLFAKGIQSYLMGKRDTNTILQQQKKFSEETSCFL